MVELQVCLEVAGGVPPAAGAGLAVVGVAVCPSTGEGVVAEAAVGGTTRPALTIHWTPQAPAGDGVMGWTSGSLHLRRRVCPPRLLLPQGKRDGMRTEDCKAMPI